MQALSSFHLSSIQGFILSEWKLLTKFQCKIQPLNVKLVIKFQMCWHDSLLKKSNSLSLSLSLSGWISAISLREQLVNVHGSAPLITYWNITHTLKNILIRCRLPELCIEYIYVPLKAIPQHIFLPTILLICVLMCVCLLIIIGCRVGRETWWYVEKRYLTCTSPSGKRSLVNKSHQSERERGKKTI